MRLALFFLAGVVAAWLNPLVRESLPAWAAWTFFIVAAPLSGYIIFTANATPWEIGSFVVSALMVSDLFRRQLRE
ncbi:hypothetical protein KEM60_00959 [Austwickia sp. TVS 96-490-7B]|nr:hypothetical protein [Austwickia sp. TVS 96-490-7B]